MTPCYLFNTETGELYICENFEAGFKKIPVIPNFAYLLFLYIEKLLYGEAA